MGCHVLLQGSLPTQGSNPCLLVSCIGRRILYTTRATWEAPSHVYLYVNRSLYEYLQDTHISYTAIDLCIPYRCKAIYGFSGEHWTEPLAGSHSWRCSARDGQDLGILPDSLGPGCASCSFLSMAQPCQLPQTTPPGPQGFTVDSLRWFLCSAGSHPMHLQPF